MGDRVSVDPDEISDWAFVQSGRLIGGYTIRVLYSELSPQGPRGIAKKPVSASKATVELCLNCTFQDSTQSACALAGSPLPPFPPSCSRLRGAGVFNGGYADYSGPYYDNGYPGPYTGPYYGGYGPYDEVVVVRGLLWRPPLLRPFIRLRWSAAAAVAALHAEFAMCVLWS